MEIFQSKYKLLEERNRLIIKKKKRIGKVIRDLVWGPDGLFPVLFQNFWQYNKTRKVNF